MSVIISVSKNADDIWIIRNSLYRWFVDLARKKFADDKRVIEALEIGEYLAGVSLDLTFESDPKFAAHLSTCICQLANEIAAGEHKLDDSPEMQDKCNAAFGRLAAMLERNPF